MRLTIVISTMNRPHDLANLLASIANQTFLPQELILVDQSVDLRTKDIFEEYVNEVEGRGQLIKYCRQDQPSLVAARNRGVRESTGDIICFVDDDIILHEDYFERIAYYFHDPCIGGVSGNVIISEKQSFSFKTRVRKVLMRLFLLSNFQGRMTASTFGYPIFERHVEKVTKVELFPGYSMNFRKQLLLRNPGDEWFKGGGFREDVDLSYRISKEAALVMVPDARFVHQASAINRYGKVDQKKIELVHYFYMFKKFKKPGLFPYVLFFYSVCGLIIIDFFELVFNFNRKKYEVFMANFSALKEYGAKDDPVPTLRRSVGVY